MPCLKKRGDNKQRKALLIYSEDCLMRNGHTKCPCEQMHTKRKAATITEVTINVLEQLTVKQLR